MVCTRANGHNVLDILEGSTAQGHGRGQTSHGNALPPPSRLSVGLEQLLTTLNELMSLLIQNETHRGIEQPQNPQC
jgi:hypothetical protein